MKIRLSFQLTTLGSNPYLTVYRVTWSWWKFVGREFFAFIPLSEKGELLRKLEDAGYKVEVEHETA